MVRTHGGINPSSLLVLAIDLCHPLATSPTPGRFFGVCCQQLSRIPHNSSVSPTSRAFTGFAGLPPCDMRSTTASFFCSSNGILPVNTSIASIAKANMSAGFDSMIGIAAPLRVGVMISGANHLEVPTAPGVAATVKLGSEFMGASPYSVKRARPFLSTTMFACDHRISVIAQPGRRERGVVALERQVIIPERSEKQPTPFKSP